MTKVHIIEKFKTSFGEIAIINKQHKLSIGDKIFDDNGNEYIVKGFQMPTKPNEDLIGICI